VVGLEPSCVAVFRDELVNLFPRDERARRLAQQTYLLGDFLARKAPDFRPPRLPVRAVVHAHCHQRAVLGTATEETVLRALGLDYTLLDAGCCGMAGAFGFEREHYDVSLACGERVLLPAVRAASDDALIVSDGFSCREQIAQTTERRALHLAEVLQLALHAGETPPPGVRPEDSYQRMVDDRQRVPVARRGARVVGAAVAISVAISVVAALAAGAVRWALRNARRR
jgi:Fe-S oxidoreductase